jgi:hypothetical protein
MQMKQRGGSHPDRDSAVWVFNTRLFVASEARACINIIKQYHPCENIPKFAVPVDKTYTKDIYRAEVY